MSAEAWGTVRWSQFRVRRLELAVASRPRPEWTGPQLTKAERAIARRLAAGASNREIAHARHTSVHTIANQAAALFRKLAVNSRLEFASAFPGASRSVRVGMPGRGGGDASAPVGPEDSASMPAGHLGAQELLLQALRARAVEVDASTASAGRDARRVWEKLSAGAWSIVDAFETRDRCYLVLQPAHAAVGQRAGGQAPFTARERTILEHIALGMSSKAIASEIGLAPSTVSSTVASLVARTGLEGRISIAQLLGGFARAAADADAHPPTSDPRQVVVFAEPVAVAVDAETPRVGSEI